MPDSKSGLAVDESYTVTIGRSGALWFATSTMHRGLLVVGHTMTEALSRVESAWAELRAAEEECAHAGR